MNLNTIIELFSKFIKFTKLKCLQKLRNFKRPFYFKTFAKQNTYKFKVFFKIYKYLVQLLTFKLKIQNWAVLNCAQNNPRFVRLYTHITVLSYLLKFFTGKKKPNRYIIHLFIYFLYIPLTRRVGIFLVEVYQPYKKIDKDNFWRETHHKFDSSSLITH